MAKKQVIRLTENDLKQIVAESVRKLTCEVSIDTLQRATQIANDNLYNNVYSTDDEKKRRTKQWMNIASQERLKYRALEKETMRLMHKYFEEFKDLDKAYREMNDAMNKGYLDIGNNIGSYNY